VTIFAAAFKQKADQRIFQFPQVAYAKYKTLIIQPYFKPSTGLAVVPKWDDLLTRGDESKL
jgi:hypothetical protein